MGGSPAHHSSFLSFDGMSPNVCRTPATEKHGHKHGRKKRKWISSVPFLFVSFGFSVVQFYSESDEGELSGETVPNQGKWGTRGRTPGNELREERRPASRSDIFRLGKNHASATIGEGSDSVKGAGS